MAGVDASERERVMAQVILYFKRHGSLLLLFAALLPSAKALDNGLARTPPMAWRSWNAYHTDMNQTLIMAVVDEVAKVRKEGISLASLGYDMVGIDEGWEGCGQGAHHTQHYANGTPAVNLAKFPDLKALVAYGHSKGVKMGFYLNGCACGEREELRINYEGDVNFTHGLGFDGVKIDSCGQQRNMTLYAELFNKTRRPIVIENCHQGQSFPDGGDPGQMGPGWCPYNLFRTSGDIINVWDRVVENLLSVQQFLTRTSGAGASPVSRPMEPPIYFPPAPPKPWNKTSPVSRPGCWAYPDMLEVGQMEGSGQASYVPLAPTPLARPSHAPPDSSSHRVAARVRVRVRQGAAVRRRVGEPLRRVGHRLVAARPRLRPDQQLAARGRMANHLQSCRHCGEPIVGGGARRSERRAPRLLASADATRGGGRLRAGLRVRRQERPLLAMGQGGAVRAKPRVHARHLPGELPVHRQPDGLGAARRRQRAHAVGRLPRRGRPASCQGRGAQLAAHTAMQRERAFATVDLRRPPAGVRHEWALPWDDEPLAVATAHGVAAQLREQLHQAHAACERDDE